MRIQLQVYRGSIMFASGHHEVAARLKQRNTAIMRFAVQSGLIGYNPAQDIAGAVDTANRQHRAVLELNRIRSIDHYSGRPLTRLAAEVTLLVLSVTASCILPVG